MRFVSSGNEALDELAVQPMDVMVSDLRMPGMDGYTLLHEVSLRASDVILIILSGTVDEDMSAGVLDLVHAVLSKPCDQTALEKAINLARAETP